MKPLVDDLIGNCGNAALLAAFASVLPRLRSMLDEGTKVIKIR